MDNQDLYDLIREIRADVKDLNKNFIAFHQDTAEKLSEYNEQLKIHIVRSDLLERQCDQRHPSETLSGKKIATIITASLTGLTILIVAIIKLFIGS